MDINSFSNVLQMKLLVDQLIAPDVCAQWVEKLEAANFEDGAKTAGWLAKTVKDNEQLPDSPLFQEINLTVQKAVSAHSQVRLYLRPKRITPLRISRYRPGMSYGQHSDDAMISGVHTHLSFTLFLKDPSSYEGGALRLHEMDGTEDFKLNPGQAIFYPSGALHEVMEVTQGERLAIVGWVQSKVPDPRKREILAEIEQSRTTLFERGDAPAEVLKLSKALSNLLRLWQQP